MKELRKVERCITNNQNEMRNMISRKELNVYNEIGEERLDDFCDTYDNKFNELKEYKI